MYSCAGPLSGYPSIKQLSDYQVNNWHEMGLQFHLSVVQMEHIRNSKYPSTETLLAAKVKNMELKWKDILKVFLSIKEFELAEHICRKRGWFSGLKCLQKLDHSYNVSLYKMQNILKSYVKEMGSKSAKSIPKNIKYTVYIDVGIWPVKSNHRKMLIPR